MHRVMKANLIPFAMKTFSTSRYIPLLCQKRCNSSNTSQDDITASYSLKELIKSVHDSQKELFKHFDESEKVRHESLKQVDESAKLRHESLRAELQAGFREVTLHMRITIGLLLLTIGIFAREWIASGFVKPRSNGRKEA